MLKVLLIADGPAIAETISLSFELLWPRATLLAANSGEKGLELAGKESPDLIILDLDLPGMRGIDVLRVVRSFSTVPVITLSVKNDPDTVFQAIERGADDFVSKPFDSDVLLARSKRFVGFQMTERGEIVVEDNGLIIDLDKRQVTRSGRRVLLSTTEWVILQELVDGKGKTVTQRMLADRLREGESTGRPLSMRTYVNRLRKKLGDDPFNPTLIYTEHGMGYCFLPSRKRLSRPPKIAA